MLENNGRQALSFADVILTMAQDKRRIRAPRSAAANMVVCNFAHPARSRSKSSNAKRRSFLNDHS
jgi:hypothetical protein